VRRSLPLVVGALLLSGCGGDDVDANGVLSQTAANLPKIKSAESLRLKLLVEPRDGEPFGFELDGPIRLCDNRPLPRLDVAYTQIANGGEATVRLISTGEDGYVEVGGTAYELDDEGEAELHSACEELGGGGGLTKLRVDDWVSDPDGSRDGDVDRVTGELDVIAVVNDLVDVARAFGGSSLSRLDRDDAERIQEAVEESRFELESGHEDRLLRRLFLEAELGFDVREELRQALGDAVGGTVTFELELERPNAQIEVRPPANPRPSTELPGR
jgi:hypothetical protein